MESIEEARNYAKALIDKSEVLHFASINEKGFPRSVPIIKLKNDGINAFYFATSLSTDKSHHIQANPKSGATFYEGCNVCSFTGVTEIITDEQSKNEFWKDYFYKYFPTGLSDPNLCICKFIPQSGEYSFSNKKIKDPDMSLNQ